MSEGQGVPQLYMFKATLRYMRLGLKKQPKEKKNVIYLVKQFVLTVLKDSCIQALVLALLGGVINLRSQT